MKQTLVSIDVQYTFYAEDKIILDMATSYTEKSMRGTLETMDAMPRYLLRPTVFTKYVIYQRNKFYKVWLYFPNTKTDY